MSNIEQIISQGLGVVPAKIYLSLVKNGEMTVPKIVEVLDLSRTIIYESLTELLAYNYITYRKEGRVVFYGPTHPSKLNDLIEEKKRETRLFEGEIKEAVHNLTGVFNISQNRPGVRFFEGVEGLKEVWDDILESGVKEFDTIGDLEAILNNVPEFNKEWLSKKDKMNIKEKTITNKTEFNEGAIKIHQSKIDEFKMIDKDGELLIENTIMDIYASKVAYTTLEYGNIIGVIIEDKNIYKMQKNIFDLIWNKTKALL